MATKAGKGRKRQSLSTSELNVTKTKITTTAGVNPHIVLDGKVVKAVDSFVSQSLSIGEWQIQSRSQEKIWPGQDASL